MENEILDEIMESYYYLVHDLKLLVLDTEEIMIDVPETSDPWIRYRMDCARENLSILKDNLDNLDKLHDQIKNQLESEMNNEK